MALKSDTSRTKVDRICPWGVDTNTKFTILLLYDRVGVYVSLPQCVGEGGGVSLSPSLPRCGSVPKTIFFQ